MMAPLVRFSIVILLFLQAIVECSSASFSSSSSSSAGADRHVATSLLAFAAGVQKTKKMTMTMTVAVAAVAGVNSEPVSERSPSSSPPVVVVGAGPAALFFAHRYLQLNQPGGRVVIYERKDRAPRHRGALFDDDDDDDDDAAFGFGLGGRAKTLLSLVPGLWEQVKAVGVTLPSGSLTMVNRADMCQVMMESLERTYSSSSPTSSSSSSSSSSYSSSGGNDGDRREADGGRYRRIEIRYNSNVTELHDNRTISVVVGSCNNSDDDDDDDERNSNRNQGNHEDESTTRIVPYSLLVGADGTNSVIRSSLVERGVLKEVMFYRNVWWKALQLPSQPNLRSGSFLPYELRLPRRREGRWRRKDGTMIEFGAILPRHKDRFVLLSFWRRTKTKSRREGGRGRGRGRPEKEAERTNFAPDAVVENPTPEGVRSFIRSHFPNVTEFPSDDVLRRYIARKPGGEVYRRLDKHVDVQRRIALIGDSAVGMYSRLGQGCASALESANRLAEAMTIRNDDNHDGNSSNSILSSSSSERLYEFSNTSVVEGHAISDLNLISHVMEIPRIRQVANKWMIQKTAPLLNRPDIIPYRDILSQYRWIVLPSKWFLWPFQRIKGSPPNKKAQMTEAPHSD